MRVFTKKQMKQLLDESGIGIENSRDNPVVLEKVSPFGITPENFTNAENLYKRAETLFLEKGPKTGRKIALTMEVRIEIDEIHDEFMIFAKMLRRDLRHDIPLYKMFNLNVPRDYTIVGKIMEPKGFYTNCLADKKIGPVAGNYGLTPESLQAKLDRITAVEKDKSVRALMVKDSEKATEERNQVFVQLNDWWQNYRLVLIYVYRDDPQQLEAFKITAYSEGYKPNRKKEEEVEEKKEDVAAVKENQS